MTSPEQHQQVLRLHLAERWRVGTIARELNLHHSTVERIVSQAGMPKPERTQRSSIIEPYLPMIAETLEQHPKLSAARLYQMALERGYSGGPSHFRQWVAQMRPRKLPEAFLRLKSLPGEQAQVDWGHFGHLKIGRADRPLMAFVVVLSHSRRIFLRFFLNAQMSSFVQGHVEAFDAFGGVPRDLLYDNLKSAVRFRHGKWIDYNPAFTKLSCHYRFNPIAVGVARGNEKGRVERSIRYIRDNFFAARAFKDLDDLNQQAKHWCEGTASDRCCPEDRDLSVREAFAAEQPLLMALPENPFDSEHQDTVKIAKTPWARFDLNDYSVPYEHVRSALSVRANERTVRFLDGETEVAFHTRCWDKAQQIEDPAHTHALRLRKQAARSDNGSDRLLGACPRAEELLTLIQQRKQGLQKAINALTALLDNYGAAELNSALDTALQSDTCHVGAVQQVLEQRREANEQLPLIPITLPEKANTEHTHIKPTDLAQYDQINPDSDLEPEPDHPQEPSI